MSQELAPARTRLGGMTRRRRPGAGGRPTIRFAVALGLTVAYVALCVYVSTPWRSDLREAIGPVMAWVIPIMLAYIPRSLIGFLAFTLLTVRYRVPSPEPPKGPWPEGRWPSVTVIVAAWNEEDTIVADHGATSPDSLITGPIEVVLADNNSTDRTAELARAGGAAGTASTIARCSSLSPASTSALNTALEGVTTPLVVTVDADTLLHRDALTFLVGRVAGRPQDQHVCACAGALVVENARHNFLTGCRAGTSASGSTASSACRPPTTARSLPRGRSRPTGPRTSARSAAGRTRSARTSCSPGR